MALEYSGLLERNLDAVLDLHGLRGRGLRLHLRPLLLHGRLATIHLIIDR